MFMTNSKLLKPMLKGRFHIIPHDVNETFTLPHSGGPDKARCRRSGPRSDGPEGERAEGNSERPSRGEREPQTNGVALDPLVAAEDDSKVLLHKLLAVREWREHYLGYVRAIADTWLDWEKLGPIATDLHLRIADDVKASTRKLATTEAFLASLTKDEQAGVGEGSDRRQRRSISLKKFADDRRAYLLNYKSTWKD